MSCGKTDTLTNRGINHNSTTAVGMDTLYWSMERFFCDSCGLAFICSSVVL